jgi:hypothetical protein
MNPEMLWQITAERIHDAQVQAHQDRSARNLRRALRAGRHSVHEAGGHEFTMPTIPDYVDGSFRAGSKVGENTGQVPAARRAA